MRTLYTVLTLCLVLSASFSHSQSLYDSFDDVRNVTYGLNIPYPDQLGNGIDGTEWPGWHGVFVQYVQNPGANDVNGSSMCASYSRNPSRVLV